MNSVLGHFYALLRLNWAGDNLGHLDRAPAVQKMFISLLTYLLEPP